jgi:CheY-like chemotaxis protein
VTSESCPASVLVVEDNEDIREAIGEILEDEGYDVVLAEDGERALELLGEMARPCLLLVDLIMPKMNGWDLLNALSKNDRLATIPVVVVSAAAKAANLEGQVVVKKPVDLAIMLQIVRAHCCGERGGGSDARESEPVTP